MRQGAVITMTEEDAYDIYRLLKNRARGRGILWTRDSSAFKRGADGYYILSGERTGIRPGIYTQRTERKSAGSAGGIYLRDESAPGTVCISGGRGYGRIMRITLITVGKIKEKYLRDAIAEYSKRLSRYCKLEIVEVADEKTPDQASEAAEENIRNKEGERILKHIRDDMYVITLEIGGKMLSSEEFADKINSLGVQGKSSIAFVIGGLHRAGAGSAQEIGLCIELFQNDVSPIS